MNAAAELELLCSQSQTCTACRLSRTRTRVVFGEGDPQAKLLVLGEGPGADEDASGRPFVGRAGQLLDQILAAAGMPRPTVYIANMVKCRPPGNRNPEPDEVEACRRWLAPQLALLRPEVIVTLGNVPTQHLLGLRAGITRTRGTWHRYRDPSGFEAWVMPMFHPAYLLRNPTRVVGGPKSLTWRDIREVKAVLEGSRVPESPHYPVAAPGRLL
ncbi:DNA polymerase [Deinobacterium chartae]|uniref:Type-4 uracil-DNA glycosylase n=1 Tax=Deinobacterium chartae TaxID=521158 RepID=A0A841I0I4_9DEIO|nr:uracil-DNA glycosylase [Deinobacterium chartae]MBB6097939.1 DNA polymerase [Deinobacterium chartae]